MSKWKSPKATVRLISKVEPRLPGRIEDPRLNYKKSPEALRRPGILLQERMVPEIVGNGYFNAIFLSSAALLVCSQVRSLSSLPK